MHRGRIQIEADLDEINLCIDKLQKAYNEIGETLNRLENRRDNLINEWNDTRKNSK